MEPKNTLLRGLPGVGKTTLLRKLAERLAGLRVGGFFTEELRERSGRVGFRVETFDGDAGLLAHVSGCAGPRVGKYVVDVAAFERIGVAGLERAVEQADVILLDEIGKMELFSDRFRQAVQRALDSARPVVATIMARPHPFADAVKRRPDIRLLAVTRSNRDGLAEDLERALRATLHA